ncbi:MAG: hypothetical protein JWL88_225 [Parcubacteria group bacterium]|nr:hypothetical protein [Parcubacteria group bacterium]
MSKSTNRHFVPDEDNLSEEHFNYRDARGRLGVDPAPFFALACADAGYPVTLAQARIDSTATYWGVKRDKRYSAPLYVTRYVDRVLKGEIDRATRKPRKPNVIFENFPCSKKKRSKVPAAVTARQAHDWDAATRAG